MTMRIRLIQWQSMDNTDTTEKIIPMTPSAPEDATEPDSAKPEPKPIKTLVSLNPDLAFFNYDAADQINAARQVLAIAKEEEAPQPVAVLQMHPETWERNLKLNPALAETHEVVEDLEGYMKALEEESMPHVKVAFKEEDK